MGLLRKRGGLSCPVCGESLARCSNIALHNLDHALPAQDGQGGFMWRCGCGDLDGVWDDPAGAAAGLTLHFRQRHGIS
jgi:hypothetical protein